MGAGPGDKMSRFFGGREKPIRPEDNEKARDCFFMGGKENRWVSGRVRLGEPCVEAVCGKCHKTFCVTPYSCATIQDAICPFVFDFSIECPFCRSRDYAWKAGPAPAKMPDMAALIRDCNLKCDEANDDYHG
jgi:hypothetical protein